MIRFSTILLVFLLSSALVSAQRNLLQDGKFENTLLATYNKENLSPEKGEWFSFVDNNVIVEKTVVGDEFQGTVMTLELRSDSTHFLESFVGQYLYEPLMPGLYRLGFSARSMLSSSEPFLTVFIGETSWNENSKLNLLKTDTLGSNKDSPVTKVKLSSLWEYYTIDFLVDQQLLISRIDTNSEHESIESRLSTGLEDCFVGFSSDIKNAQLRFTDVSLRKIK